MPGQVELKTSRGNGTLKTIAAVVVAIASVTVMIMAYGKYQGQVDRNTKDIRELRIKMDNVSDRLRGVEENTEAIKDNQDRVLNILLRAYGVDPGP